MIRRAEEKDLPILAELACQLWPDHTAEEMGSEFAEIMAKPDAVFFLTYAGKTAIGFAQCQLRYDYVEGTDSSPVGYLEGIYVAEGYRAQGVAKQLLAACESWARSVFPVWDAPPIRIITKSAPYSFFVKHMIRFASSNPIFR